MRVVQQVSLPRELTFSARRCQRHRGEVLVRVGDEHDTPSCQILPNRLI